MEKKHIIPDWVSVIFVLLCIGAIGVQIKLMPQPLTDYSSFVILTKVLDCLTFLAALIYCVMGYKKESAIVFRFFCVAYLVASFFVVYSDFMQQAGFLKFLAAMIVFGIMSIFSIAKDLGKKKSYTMLGLIIVCAVLDIIASAKLGGEELLSSFGQVVLAGVFFLMIFAKFADKAARGSK